MSKPGRAVRSALLHLVPGLAVLGLASSPILAKDELGQLSLPVGVGTLAAAPHLERELQPDGRSVATEAGLDARWQEALALGRRRVQLEAGYGGELGLADLRAPDHELRAAAGVNGLRVPRWQAGRIDLEVGYGAAARRVDAGSLEGRVGLQGPVGGQIVAEGGLGLEGDMAGRRRGELELAVDLPTRWGRLSAAHGVDVGFVRARTRAGSLGLDLEAGSHRFALVQSLRRDGSRAAVESETELAYRWQRDRVDVALGASYTPAGASRAADLFAGIAISVGFDAPGAVDLLAALR
jgi:hypothetical protein